jgi:hypothetical protein
LHYENQSYLSSYLTSKERHGLKKKNERIKQQKALVFKKRERKTEKKESSHALSKRS